MNTKRFFLLSIICCISGILLYAIHKGWIIFNTPDVSTQDITHQMTSIKSLPKKVTLFFWHQNSWQHETKQLVWGEHIAQNSAYLINSWLSLLEDEKIIIKKVMLQTAMLNSSGNELYLSFDRSLCSKEATTYEKWMLIEGLLKTLRENGITPQTVRFLVHHQPMIDVHLDFSASWPIFGFINT